MAESNNPNTNFAIIAYSVFLAVIVYAWNPIDAEGNIPNDPVITDASSVIISPNIFSVKITSNSVGFVIIFMAALSTKR